MLLYQGLRLALNPATPDVVSMVGGGGKSSTAFRLAAEVATLGKRAVIAPSTRIAAFQTAWAPAFVEVSGAELPWGELERQLARHHYCLLGGPVVGDRRLGLEAAQIDALAPNCKSPPLPSKPTAAKCARSRRLLAMSRCCPTPRRISHRSLVSTRSALPSMHVGCIARSWCAASLRSMWMRRLC